jgi:hypothetical protein
MDTAFVFCCAMESEQTEMKNIAMKIRVKNGKRIIDHLR